MTESGPIADMERTALSQCSGYTFTYVESGEVALARQGHRGPTWSRRSTILVRRAGDRRLGLEHGRVLVRLVAYQAVSQEVDRQRTHLGLGSRRIASRVAAHMTVPRQVSVSCFGRH